LLFLCDIGGISKRFESVSYDIAFSPLMKDPRRKKAL